MIKANLAYAIGSAARSAALFFLIPFLVNVFTPEEYGAWALIEVAVLLLNSFILAGINNGLMRRHWFTESEEERKEFAGIALFFVIGWGAILMVILSGAAAILKLDVPNAPITIQFTIWISLVEAIFDLLLTIFRIREKAYTFVVLSLGRMISFLLFSVWLVVMDFGLTGALAGRMFSGLLSLLVAFWMAKPYYKFKIDWQKLRWMVRYGLPLLPTNIAMYIMFASDRYILNIFSTLESVAVYSFAYKIATTLDILVTRPFSSDWAPRRFKIAARQNAPRQYARVLLVYLWFICSFALGILAVTPIAYHLLAPPVYLSGLRTVPVILLAYVIYGLSYPINVGIMLKEGTRELPIIGWFAALICLGLNFLWIPRYGFTGAAWATVVAYSFWTGGIAFASLREYAVPYSVKRIAWIVSWSLIGYAAIHWVSQASFAGNIYFAAGLNLGIIFLAIALMGLAILDQIKPKWLDQAPRRTKGKVVTPR